jgi:uncharacterized repeat protein (TIGR03803 family)
MKTQNQTNPRGFTLRALQPITLATALALSLLGGVAHAQTGAYTVLHHFDYLSGGANPSAGLVLDGDTLYGTTCGPAGTVFKLNTDGTGYTLLKDFANHQNEGCQPRAGLLLSGGTLYGTTTYGGTNNLGTVFKLSAEGTGFTVLKHFTGPGPWKPWYPDGRLPMAGLILSGNTLYGTTYGGGTWDSGTVFKLDTNGTGFTVLKHFNGPNGEGAWPKAALVLSGNTLYGTTEVTKAYVDGGGEGNGTVFVINTDGTGFTVLKYCDFDASRPEAELLLSGSTLYGTTSMGPPGFGTVFKINTDGTGFTIVRNFPGPTSDARPYAGLVLSGSTLYGSAIGAGCQACPGEIFKVDTNGTNFAVLKSFNSSDGYSRPQGRLVLSGSSLYGTTYSGGSSNLGTVFKLELAPQLGAISLSSGVPQIRVTGAGEVLQIQVSSNLLSGWDVLTNVALVYGRGWFSDPDATNYPMRFYRAVLQ